MRLSKCETPKCLNTSGVSMSVTLRETNMQIIAKSDLNFHGTALIPVSNITGTWLTSSDLAKALQYANSRAVTMIYNKYADEFSSGMSQVLEVSTTGNYRKKVRVFSLRGAHLIAMFARTDIAKEFRRWVLDILDREVAHSPIAKQFTDEELQSLCWLWKNSVRMASHIADVEPLLRVAEHRLAPAFYSMPREYSNNMNASRALLERETMHVPVNAFTNDNWRVLNNLRIGKGIH